MKVDMLYDLVAFAAAVVAGGVASVTGFGVGSLLTPVLSFAVGAKVAIALTSIPHLIATAMRLWMLRTHVDKKILFQFGLTSAVGGLVGALLHSVLKTPSITIAFGCILLFSGFMGATGFSERLRFGGIGAWIAGGISGFLGGLVGNQGSIRSAALLGFDIPKIAFVATATATALIVDGARMPVYFVSQFPDVVKSWVLICITVAGAIIGTLAGAKILRNINESTFRKVVSAFIFVLGAFMLYQGLGSKL